MAEKILIRETLPEKSPEKQGKNDLFAQSHNQQNPRDAKPSDFVVLKSEDAATAEYIGHGQSGTNADECRKLKEATAADRGKSKFRKSE